MSLVAALADEGARVREECRSNSLAAFGINRGQRVIKRTRRSA